MDRADNVQRLLDRSGDILKFKGEPFRCWKKAKELRMKIYTDYRDAPEQGKLRVAGGAYSLMPLAHGLGDVAWLSSEPYSASTAHEPEVSRRFMDAAEAKGWARDLCGYMRNYWGTMLLDEYGAFGGRFPSPDVLLQAHLCCSHAKWYQVVKEYSKNKDLPFWTVDVCAGPYEVEASGGSKPPAHRLRYVADQILDTIDEMDEWLRRTQGRSFDDERFIQALLNDIRASTLWAEICTMQKAVPAPMDEKSIFAFFNLCGIARTLPEVVAFYEELLSELKDRVARGVAGSPGERYRVFGDSPPPWAHLDMFRYLEEYGCVSIGSFYSFAIFGYWERDVDGKIVPRRTPQEFGVVPSTREEAAMLLAEIHLAKTMAQHASDPTIKSRFLVDVVEDWSVDAVLMHYNRGCELTTLSAPEMTLALKKAGVPVMTYEGNMGDGREFDMPRVKASIDTFMESLGMKKIR